MISLWSQLKIKIQDWVNAALRGTHDHYSCYLPKNLGMISEQILKLFFSGIRLNKDQTPILSNLPENAVIVYTNQYKSYFEFLFYHTRYKADKLPFPEIGLDYQSIAWQPVSRIFQMLLAHIDYFRQNRKLPDPYKSGYIQKELISGRIALVSLLEKKGGHRRFVKARVDPIRYLIDMQRSLDRPIYIIPQIMFFGKKPHHSTPSVLDIIFGSKEMPGSIRRLVAMFKNPGTVFVEISEPVNLQNFVRRAENGNLGIEHVSFSLRRHLMAQINRHRQSIIGPVLKSREELKENILTSDRLRKYMEQYSKKRDIPIYKVHKKADAYLEEIAAKYNISIIKTASVLVSWLLNSLFEGISINDDVLKKVKSMSHKAPLILIPCHKSHLDYIILSYVLHKNDMPCPMIAAGKNLSFWPMGALFRSAGAFFIRRTFRGAVLYAKVFSEYIHQLLAEGFNIEFFIEGGRSRTGKLTLPKLGLLTLLINAFKQGACDDMIFVPIYIGYDRVMEESSYLHEIEGGQKEAESLWQVFKARKLLHRRYGRIYIKFNDPISFNALLSRNNLSIHQMSAKEQNAVCRDLGCRLINAINSVTVVTPFGLLASALLNSPKNRFSREQLKFQIDTYITFLYSRNVIIADTLVMDQETAIEHAIESFAQRKFIEQISPHKDDTAADIFFKVNESKRPLIEYYKNNCIAFFVPAAFTALAIIEKDAFQFSSADLLPGYNFLKKLFQNEFTYHPDQSPETVIRKAIKAFIDDAVLMPHPTMPDTYNLTSVGFRKLKIFGTFLKTYFESYWIVLNIYRQYPRNSIDSKDRMKKIQAKGNRYYKRNEIERKEALSTVNFQNAIDFFTSIGIKGAEDKEKIEYYLTAFETYLNCL